MAGAIALDLRDGERENVFAVALVRCIRISVLFIHSFLPIHLGCIVLRVVHT